MYAWCRKPFTPDVQCTVYNVHCILYNVNLCTIYSVLRMQNVHGIVLNVQYIIYTTGIDNIHCILDG